MIIRKELRGEQPSSATVETIRDKSFLPYLEGKVFSGGMLGGLSIRYKFILPFFLLITLAMSITGYIFIVTNSEMAEEFILDLLDQTSRRIVVQIGNYLEKPRIINEINAALMSDNVIAVARKDDLLRYFYHQGKIFPDFGTIAFASPEGDFYGANVPEDYIVMADRALTDRAIRRFLPDKHGNRTASVIREKSDYDATTRGWFKTAFAAQKPTWTPIEASVTGQRLDCSAVHPLIIEGKFRGVFLVDVSLQEITKYLKELSIGKSGQAFIIDNFGEIVAGSAVEKPFTVDNTVVKRLKAIDGNFPLISSVYSQLLLEYRDLGLLNEPIRKKMEIEGKEWLFQATPYRDDFLKWTVVVLAPKSDFDHSGKIVKTLAATWGVVLLLSVIVCWRLGNQIAKPISELVKIGNLISQGKTELTLLPETRKDEVGDLMRSFNRLVISLKLAMEKLKSGKQ